MTFVQLIFDLPSRFALACRRMATHIRSWAERLWLWMGPSVSSMAGRVNWIEAAKVIILALTTGGVSGALHAVASSPAMFNDPQASAAAGTIVAIVIGLLDFFRRKGHDVSQLDGGKVNAR